MTHNQLRRPGIDPTVEAPVLAAASLGADDTGCTVLHVDLDSFYASVSLLSRPDLTGQPVLVGGGGNRGVVLSANYQARAHGVHSAMPMARARRLCPQAQVLAPDHERYAQVSAEVMGVLATFTPVVEPLGLDEAFLDVAGARRRLGSPAVVAAAIREQVFEQVGVTCSVGVAATTSVAKIASARCKPDGLLVVPAAAITAFLHPLPIGALWGVGEHTEAVLARLGLRTVADVAHTPLATLRRALGEATGTHLHEVAWGRGSRAVAAPSSGGRSERSAGAQETFSRDLDDPDLVLAEVLRLSGRTASRLRRSGLAGRTVVLTVRSADFTTITRSRTLAQPTDLSREVYAAAGGLWHAVARAAVSLRVRMVGVRVEGLVDASRVPRQLRLGERERGWRHVEGAVEVASARFGAAAVRPAVLARAGTRVIRLPTPLSGTYPGHHS